MALTQGDKAAIRALHQGPGAFVIPNPWDAGSARVLAGLGFAGAGHVERRFRGHPRPAGREGDPRQRRSHTHEPSSRRPTCRSPPISRRGSVTRPAPRPRPSGWPRRRGWSEARSKTSPAIRPGPSSTSARPRPVWRRPCKAARALPFPFTLTARAENFLRGNPSLDDTIARLPRLRAGGRGRALRPGPAGSGGGASSLRRPVEAGQLHGRDQEASPSPWESSRRPA